MIDPSSVTYVRPRMPDRDHVIRRHDAAARVLSYRNVETASRVVGKRKNTTGRVAVADDVVNKRMVTQGLFSEPTVLFDNASLPIATLLLPVVFRPSAPKPKTALSEPLVLLKSTSAPMAVLPL